MSESYILVVDDDPDTRKILQLILTTLPVRAMYAHDGMEALIFIRVLPPLLILLDLSIPHVGGREVLRVLQSHPQNSGIPVIVFTAHPIDAKLVKDLAMPAEHIVHKCDISMTRLRKMIVELLGKQITLDEFEQGQRHA